MDSRGSSSLAQFQKSSSKSRHGQSAASPHRSPSAAAAAAIFLRNNSGGRETIAKKKRLSCYCSLPPLSIKCPLHRFGSWLFRMLERSTSDCRKNKKSVVLPVSSSGISLAFTNLRKKGQKKPPSRFFFEHQSRVASEASSSGFQ